MVPISTHVKLKKRKCHRKTFYIYEETFSVCDRESKTQKCLWHLNTPEGKTCSCLTYQILSLLVCVFMFCICLRSFFVFNQSQGECHWLSLFRTSVITFCFFPSPLNHDPNLMWLIWMICMEMICHFEYFIFCLWNGKSLFKSQCCENNLERWNKNNDSARVRTLPHT